MSKSLTIAIIGAAGYVGGELLRLLQQHPDVSKIIPVSQSKQGETVSEVHAGCWEIEEKFVAEVPAQVDVIFLCGGHGNSLTFLRENKIAPETLVIDLSRDFRMENTEGFIYALPEWNRKKIIHAKRIANPGCFATAIQLGILPFLKKKCLPVHMHIQAMTGSTGAGYALSESTHFSYRYSNVSAYKVFQHEHQLEINRTIRESGIHLQEDLNFVSLRGPFTRGIFATLTLLSDQDVYSLFQAQYHKETFVHVIKGSAELKSVINTNHSTIGIEQMQQKVLITVAIDNLLKGAAGQAVQNMNIALGKNEMNGLTLKASVY